MATLILGSVNNNSGSVKAGGTLSNLTVVNLGTPNLTRGALVEGASGGVEILNAGNVLGAISGVSKGTNTNSAEATRTKGTNLITKDRTFPQNSFSKIDVYKGRMLDVATGNIGLYVKGSDFTILDTNFGTDNAGNDGINDPGFLVLKQGGTAVKTDYTNH